MSLSREGQALVRAYQSETERLVAALIRLVEVSWGGLDNYRTADIEAWARTLAPRLDGAQARMGSLTAAYLARLETIEAGETAEVVALRSDELTSEALRGVDSQALLRRAGERVWRGLADGNNLVTSVEFGRQRAVDMAETGVQLARTHSSRAALDKPGIVGYRRVLRGTKTCALCAVASTQRYHKGDLMPIHPGCHCSVAPIIGSKDPGQVIDADRLEQTHAQIAERFGGDVARDARAIDYRQQLVVHDHGEIGPVLAVRGQTFTGPDDLAA